jgi:hypothetical protein
MMATQRNYKIPMKGFAEGLYPILQSKNVNYDSDSGIGFFKDDEGNPVSDEELGRFSICLATIKDLLSTMVDIGLFQLTMDNFLYSESLNERMKHREEISIKRMESGRLGGLANAKQAPKQLLSSKVKESKVKESKVKDMGIGIPASPVTPTPYQIHNLFEIFVKEAWNAFCLKYPKLSKIEAMTGTRRNHLKARFTQDTFKDFPKILEAIERQPGLINGFGGDKHKNWHISFDWLIGNDTNHVKVLENKYGDNNPGLSEEEIMQKFRSKK